MADLVCLEMGLLVWTGANRTTTFIIKKHVDASMTGFVSFEKRDYHDFKKQISNEMKPLFETIRTQCLALDENVVEDVRMHKIVFGKSMTFRWFADVKPDADKIVVKIQKSRKETPQVFEIQNNDQVSELMCLITSAFKQIS